MRIAIPRFGEMVAPCFEYSATMGIFTVNGDQVIEQIDIQLETRVPYDRVRLMKVEQVDVVICGGVQEFYEDLLKANDIRVISWVSGKIEDLIGLFLEGKLASGTARLGACGDAVEPPDDSSETQLEGQSRG